MLNFLALDHKVPSSNPTDAYLVMPFGKAFTLAASSFGWDVKPRSPIEVAKWIPLGSLNLHLLSLLADWVFTAGIPYTLRTTGSRLLWGCSSYWIDARQHVSQGVSYTMYAQNIIHGDHEEA